MNKHDEFAKSLLPKNSSIQPTNDEEKKARRIIYNMEMQREFVRRTYIAVKNQFGDNYIHIRENMYGERIVVQMIFKTQGCRMRKAGSCWNCNYGASDIVELNRNQIIKEFREKIKQSKGNVLVLESFGSITDSKEFDKGLFKEIIKIAIEESEFPTILIETHMRHISEELVQYIDGINKEKNKNIGFEVGVEDMNPQNRKLINKIGVDNVKLFELYEMLQRYGMELDINLIYGFPFMNEKERIEATYNSVKEISRQMPESAIVLFLMSVKENTIMEEMFKNEIYNLPNPWGFIELINKILKDDEIGNIITFSWFGEKEDPYVKDNTCYTCEECRTKIIEAIRRINGTFDKEDRTNIIKELMQQTSNQECDCYDTFKSQLQKNDGQTVQMRYINFIKDVNKYSKIETHNQFKISFSDGNKGR